jgi:hypothetical protein
MASQAEPELPAGDIFEESRRLLEHFGRLAQVMEANGFLLPDDSFEMLGVPRPRLHQFYTAEEGVAAFAEGPGQWLCDGQFAALPGRVLGFFTLGDPGAGPSVETPTRVLWRPGRPDYAPDEEEPWLPRAVREPRGPDGERHREYHLFLRAPSEERYLYAGPAGLGGWTNPFVPQADFLLRARLPREAWERLGGYPGWRVWVDGHSERLEDGDTAGLARLLARLTPEQGSICLTRYEEDNLTVALNADRGCVWYTGPDGRSHGAARDPAGEAGAGEMVLIPDPYLAYEVPREDTVPRPLAIEAAREFFRTGRRPECVAWPEAPPAAAPLAEPPGEPAPRIGLVTEAEWLTCTDPDVLLTSLREAPAWDWLAGVDLQRPARPIRRLLDDRKLRLLAAACCRRVWHLMTDERSRRMVVVFERHTEGRATDEEWARGGAAARAAWQEASNRSRPEDEDPAAAAAHAALRATTTAAAQLGPGVLQAMPKVWASAVASNVLRETARAVAPHYTTSPERGPQCDLIRDIFGNPFRPIAPRPDWLTPTVKALAEEIYEGQAFDELPVLADALEDAGCDEPAVLEHCRNNLPHVRGCWVIDLLRGKSRPQREACGGHAEGDPGA